MWEAVQIAGVYIATIIGAGFASGSEIINYFVRYGRISALGIAFCAVCFGFLATVIVKRARESGVECFSEYLHATIPGTLVHVIEKLIVLFMMVVYVAMLAGTGEALADFCGISKSVGVVLLSGISLVVFFFDLKGLMAANGVLSAVIVAGIVGVCWYILNFRETAVSVSNMTLWDNWMTSGISYVSYNILTACVILVEMGIKMRGKAYRAVGVISGVALLLLLGCLWVVLSIYHGHIPLGSIPMLTICKRMGFWLSLFYTIILFVAMLTTALSNGYAVVNHMSQYMNRRLAIGLVLCVGYFCAGLDFPVIINGVYRMIGYMGAGFVVFILLAEIKLKKKIK